VYIRDTANQINPTASRNRYARSDSEGSHDGAKESRTTIYPGCFGAISDPIIPPKSNSARAKTVPSSKQCRILKQTALPLLSHPAFLNPCKCTKRSELRRTSSRPYDCHEGMGYGVVQMQKRVIVIRRECTIVYRMILVYKDVSGDGWLDCSSKRN
jgi:hypothetical protein